jgi:hypothetical protein
MRRAIAGAGAVLILSISAAAADAREFIGVNQGARFDRRDIQAIAATGAQTYRFMLGWPRIEPTPGEYKWGSTDLLVGGGAVRGIRSLPFAWGSPKWVAKSTPYPPIDSAGDRRAWREFLEAAVNRYGPGGSYWGKPYHRQFGPDAKPLPVKAWQICPSRRRGATRRCWGSPATRSSTPTPRHGWCSPAWSG